MPLRLSRRSKVLSARDVPALATAIEKALPRMSIRAISKYRAVRTLVGDTWFASRAEARYYGDLLILQRIGHYTRVELQPRFDLVVNGVKVCSYVGDFSVVRPDGEVQIIDCKGFLTPAYRIKRRLFEACMGFSITEVKRGDR
jgi:hypothetical protein